MVPEEPARVDVVVLPVSPELAVEARVLTRELREAKLGAIDTPYRAGKLTKELRAADQGRIRLAVILGPDELTRGLVEIKDLWAQGENQDAVCRDEIVAEVRKRLRSSSKLGAGSEEQALTPDT